MAFVNEVIPSSGPDREWYDSFQFKEPLTMGEKEVSLKKWTIDRERKMFLHLLGGCGNLRDEIPEFYVFVIENDRIYMEVRHEENGFYRIAVDKIWIIEKVIIPNKYKPEKEKIIHTIKEAFMKYGVFYSDEYMRNVKFEAFAEPIFA
jgi:hypothetical protein